MPDVQPFNKYRESGAYHFNSTVGAKRLKDYDIRLSARYATAIHLLKPVRDEKILDAGGGEGTAAFMCVKQGACATNFEYDEIACELSRKIAEAHGIPKERLTVVMGNLYSLPFPDSTFDGIVSLEVIEHMDRIEDYLGELHRVLKPGGRIVISTPHKRSDGVLQDKYHVTEFDAVTLRETISHHFTNVEVYSGWSARMQARYESNFPFALAGKIKRTVFRFLARAGWNIFEGYRAYNDGCPLLFSSAKKSA